MRFGKNREKGIMLDSGLTPKVVLVDEVGEDKLLVHDETSEMCALLVSRLVGPEMPTPIGVLRAISKPSYDELLNEQIARAASGSRGSVQDLLDVGAWNVP